MAELTPEQTARVARLALFGEWRRQLAAGSLTRSGLLALRCRVAEFTREFEPGPDLDLLRIELWEAIARVLRVDPFALPGTVVVPDFPPDDPPPG